MSTAARLPMPPRSTLARLLERTPVRRIMRPGVVSVAGNASLLQVADAMSAHGVHAILVLDAHSSSPAGWVNSAALLERLLEYSPFEPAAAAITEEPLCIVPSASVADAVHTLAGSDVTHLLVTPGPTAAPQGVVSDTDIIRFAASRA